MAYRANAPPMPTAPMARLASGPAAAIQPSARGVVGSRSRRAMPPSAHRSIDVVVMP